MIQQQQNQQQQSKQPPTIDPNAPPTLHPIDIMTESNNNNNMERQQIIAATVGQSPSTDISTLDCYGIDSNHQLGVNEDDDSYEYGTSIMAYTDDDDVRDEEQGIDGINNDDHNDESNINTTSYADMHNDCTLPVPSPSPHSPTPRNDNNSMISVDPPGATLGSGIFSPNLLWNSPPPTGDLSSSKDDDDDDDTEIVHRFSTSPDGTSPYRPSSIMNGHDDNDDVERNNTSVTDNESTIADKIFLRADSYVPITTSTTTPTTDSNNTNNNGQQTNTNNTNTNNNRHISELDVTDTNNSLNNNLNNSNEAQYNGNDTLNDTLQSSSYYSTTNNNNSNNYYKKGICQPSSRIVKYLCLTSIVLVVCALALAATGLGMLYTSNKNTQQNQNQQEDGGVVHEEFTPGSVEELPRFNFTFEDEKFEFVIDPVDEFIDEEEEEEDGPKAKLDEEDALDDDLDVGPFGFTRPGGLNLPLDGTSTNDNEEDILDGLDTSPSPTPDPLSNACLRNSQCDTTYEFCEYELGICDRKNGVGVCSVMPEMCADVYEPVW